MAKDSTFKISVVICNYNESRFLIDLIGKVRAEKPDEIIVVDDRSTDRSDTLLALLDVRVVAPCGPRNPFNTFVAGCQAATSDFVACFSADDYPLPGYISAMREAISKYPITDIYTCNAKVIREGAEYSRILLPFTAYISPDYMVKIFKAGFAKNVNMCGILMRRTWPLQCWEMGGWRAKVNFDCLFTFLTAFDKGIIHIGKCLACYRSFPASYGAKGKNNQIKKAISVHKEIFRAFPAAYRRAVDSGMWTISARWKALIALWGIMKLPKWVRVKFYRWFYAYNQRIEKL